MKKLFRRILLTAVLIAGLLIVLLGGFLGYASIKYYHPPVRLPLTVGPAKFKLLLPDSLITLATWNIGYCGLGKEMDFFYEGGSMVRPGEDQYTRYREGVIRQLREFGQPDFILLQEVDQDSKRSYHDDQVVRISSVFPDYAAAFAINYKSVFVPVPPTEPMGKVLAGQLTLSRCKPAEASRYAFSSSYSWPKNLFMLERCFILTRYKVSNGKELVILNTHNSAFDDAAEMRKQELALFKSTMEAEFAKGNYVVAGGDWNLNPVPYDSTAISDGNAARGIHPGIPSSFLPAGWHWAYDSEKATNRDVNAAYQKGKTLTTIIDFFVLSPNIELKEVKTLFTGFEYSDHQPVRMSIRLK